MEAAATAGRIKFSAVFVRLRGTTGGSSLPMVVVVITSFGAAQFAFDAVATVLLTLSSVDRGEVPGRPDEDGPTDDDCRCCCCVGLNELRSVGGGVRLLGMFVL